MEYPKALYKDGEAQIVHGGVEEQAARAAGYADWLEDHQREEAPAPVVKRAYNRKPKAE